MKEPIKSKEIASEDSLELIIKEDDEKFLSLAGMNSKAFEVILRINNNSFVFNHSQKIIQFIVVLKTQIDTETLKFLISEFVVNRVTDDLGVLLETYEGIMFNIHHSVILEILRIRVSCIWNHSMTILLLRNMNNCLYPYSFFYNVGKRSK